MYTEESRPVPVPVYVRQEDYRTRQEDYRTGQEDYRTGHGDYRTGQEDYRTGQEDYRTGHGGRTGLQDSQRGIDEEPFQHQHDGQPAEYADHRFNQYGSSHHGFSDDGGSDDRSVDNGYGYASQDDHGVTSHQLQNNQRVQSEEENYANIAKNTYDSDSYHQDYQDGNNQFAQAQYHGDHGSHGDPGDHGSHGDPGDHGDYRQDHHDSQNHGVSHERRGPVSDDEYSAHDGHVNTGYQPNQYHGSNNQALHDEGHGPGYDHGGAGVAHYDRNNQYERQVGENDHDSNESNNFVLNEDDDINDYQIEEEFEEELNRNGGGFGDEINQPNDPYRNINNRHQGQDFGFGGQGSAKVYLQGFGQADYDTHQGDDRSTDFEFDDFHDDQYDYDYHYGG